MLRRLLVNLTLVDNADGLAFADGQGATGNKADDRRQQNLILQSAAYLLLEGL